MWVIYDRNILWFVCLGNQSSIIHIWKTESFNSYWKLHIEEINHNRAIPSSQKSELILWSVIIDYVPACHDPGWPGPGRCVGQVTVLLASWVPRTAIGKVIIIHHFNILLIAFHAKRIHNLSDGKINYPFIREDIVYVL